MIKPTVLALIAVLSLYAAVDVDSLTQRGRTSLKQARAADSTASLADAEDAVHKALEIAPENFDARKLEVRVLLAQHRFREALDKAKPLNEGTPDDVEAWGLVSDAALGLGDYAEAERSAQWMLNLRSTNIGGLQRGARLRELFGDTQGAREFWQSAMRLALADDEERAWIATQLASLDRRSGQTAQAEGLLVQILKSMPDYQPATAELARVRMDQHKYAEAAAMFQERFKKVPRPDVRFELAGALHMAGREAEAQAEYKQFERDARGAVDAPYNYNRELVLYYTDRASNATEALRVAKIEAGRRQDVETLDAYAWALYTSGDLAESQKQMDKALAVGVRDAAFLAHAESIASKRKGAPRAD
jgi:tetratricopeptide (TPR) repeat protein